MIGDRVNLMYIMAMITFIIGLVFRVVSALSYEQIFHVNNRAFNETKFGESPYGATTWDEFKNLTSFSSVSAMLSNDQNPLYNDDGILDEAKKFVKDDAAGIWPFNFISAIENGSKLSDKNSQISSQLNFEPNF